MRLSFQQLTFVAAILTARVAIAQSVSPVVEFMSRGDLAFHKDDFVSAEQTFKEAVSVAGAVGAPQAMIQGLCSLSDVYLATGRIRESHAVLLRAIRIAKGSLTEQNALVPMVLDRIGRERAAAKHYSSAESHLRRAMRQYELLPGADPFQLAKVLEELAHIARRQQRHDQAEQMYLRVISLSEQLHGRNSPENLVSLRNIAAMYKDQDRYADALMFYRKQLEILESDTKMDRGPKQLTLIGALEELADIYTLNGELDASEPALLRALRIVEESSGPASQRALTSLGKLAKLYVNQGRGTDAELAFRRRVEILRASHEQIEYARALREFGIFYRTGSRYQLAEPLLKQALKVAERALRKDNPEVAAYHESLAVNYHRRGNFGSAEQHYLRGLEIRRRALDPSHPDVATSLSNLAALYYTIRNLKRSENLYRQAIAIREQTDQKSAAFASDLDGLGALLLRAGQEAEGLQAQSRAEQIRTWLQESSTSAK